MAVSPCEWKPRIVSLLGFLKKVCFNSNIWQEWSFAKSVRNHWKGKISWVQMCNIRTILPYKTNTWWRVLFNSIIVSIRQLKSTSTTKTEFNQNSFPKIMLPCLGMLGKNFPWNKFLHRDQLKLALVIARDYEPTRQNLKYGRILQMLYSGNEST